ncbi:MAG: aminotransferase class V-fold PLP-dependent enzyme [Planctomycetes bacterium]|nr:aminotransferase class V-fold PLP-dependent enzyme [Planctomycetota bacterium]
MPIYLDNAATSWPKPPAVEQEMRRFLAEDAGNPGRSAHRMALAAERMIDQLRVRLARMFDAETAARLVFTLNATDALNMAIKGVLRPGDHAVTTALEHNSVSRPLHALADQGVIILTRVPMTGGGFVDPDAVAAAITPATRLIVCTHCSNVIGTIQPIADIGRIARRHDVVFLVDAAQSAGLLPISMREMCVDLLAIPGHKALLGPTGTGALLVGSRVDPRPWREGGTGGDSASPVQPPEYPHRLEGGTPNTVGLAGLAAALDEIERRSPSAILAHERALARRLVEELRDDRRFHLLGPDDADRRTGVVSFTMNGLGPQETAAILDESFDIAVRAGLHCAPYIHAALGTRPDGAVRVSPGPFNSTDDIARLIDALRAIASA